MNNLRSVIRLFRCWHGFYNATISAGIKFRKLLLYPTELRGLLAPLIFYFTLALHGFYTQIHYISLIFTKPIGKTSGFLKQLWFQQPSKKLALSDMGFGWARGIGFCNV